MKKLLMLFLCLIAVSGNIFAQTPPKIERDLVAAIKQVKKYSDYGSNYDGDKLAAANKTFAEKLLKYAGNAATLNYAFPLLGKSIFIATSDDRKFRIYSWDLEGGGTMHEYSRVYQYLGANGKVYAQPESKEEEYDAGSFVYSIFTQNTKNGTIYAVCSTAILSNPDHYQTVSLYKIAGAELKDKVKLFKTAEGLTDSIGFEYDFFLLPSLFRAPLSNRLRCHGWPGN